ncbi:MAG: RluA family pseudouridine synthase [Acidobacteriota bacterium]|nr:RluA family pseudouridine synthase [Acidobacteriota bacterium]
MSHQETIRWQVDAGEDRRLDVEVAAHLGESRNRVQRWIRDGHLLLEERVALKPAESVSEGHWIECSPPRPEVCLDAITPEPGEVPLLWQDPALAIVDKPAGLAMHPGAGRDSGTLAHRLVAKFPEIAMVGHPRRPGIVHRLDIGTSGAVAVARTEAAYQGLSSAFAQREVRKTYLAIVYGEPTAGSGEIRTRIARDPRDRKRMAVSERAGREAVTIYRTLASVNGLSLLELDLETGRTHQIRVHLKWLGHPLIGDPTYGEARWKGLAGGAQRATRAFSRPALHAWRLALAHPILNSRIEVAAPFSSDLAQLWKMASGDAPPLPE